MKQHGVIYKHTNNINGKVYIGQTIRVEKVERRWRRDDKTHRSYSSCPAFFHALNKYGWENFHSEIIFSAFDQESLNRAEEYFIKYYKALVPTGYNSTMIVDGSVKFTPEIKKKIGDKQREFHANLETPRIAHNRKQHTMIDGVPHKDCASCKEVKSLENFNKYADRWDGLWIYCQTCTRIMQAERPYEKMSEEDFKKSYEGRQDPDKQRQMYIDNPGLRALRAKQRSKPVIATNVETGVEIEFESAKSAKQFGFDNTRIGQAIKTGVPHKKHTWRFK